MMVWVPFACVGIVGLLVLHVAGPHTALACMIGGAVFFMGIFVEGLRREIRRKG